MKKLQYTVIVTFTAILAVLSVLSLFRDSDGFSSFENRYLAASPEFSAKEFFTGDFTDKYETYLLDNFLLRDLSIMGYQSYSNLMFLDAFSEGETVLASVDADTFVTAGGQDDLPPSGLSDRNQNGGRRYPGTGDVQGVTGSGQNGTHKQPYEGGAFDGLRSVTGDQPAAVFGQDQDRETGPSSGQQSEAAGSADESRTEESGDTDLVNSLIISGDRIMMPAGSSGNLAHFGEIISEFAAIMPDVRVYSITGPTSAAFYASEKYSTGVYDQSRAEKIISSSAEGVTVVKVYEMLKEHSDEYIYFRSDVHWSALGAYYAYAAFCESAGMEAADIDEDFTKYTYEPFLGGMYSQIYMLPQAARLKNNPEQLDYYIPKLGHRVTLYTMGDINTPRSAGGIINTDFQSLGAYKYSCFAWGDQRLERIDTDNPNGRKALVIKDSYGSALISFLVHNYSLIYVIDPKGFNNEGSLEFDAKTLIADEEIDDVLFCFSIYGSARDIIRDSLAYLLLG